MSAIPTFKCILIGNARAGKSAFLAAHMGVAIPREYSATLGVNVAPLTFTTPDGKQQIRFNVWDCAGDPKFEGLGKDYYVDADCAIIAIDMSDILASSYIPVWQAKLPATIPFVVIGVHDILPTVPMMTAAPHMYYVSSTKALGLLAPFTDLARRLASIDLDPVIEPSSTDKFVDPKTIDIRALMRNYHAAYVTVAVSEFETIGKELRARSGMEVNDAQSPVYIATFPEKVIDEFLTINGILMNYSECSRDGNVILGLILGYIKRPAAHVHVTQEFIDNLDVLMLEFFIKRTAQIREVMRGTEHIYREAIEKLAASTSAAIKDAQVCASK